MLLVLVLGAILTITVTFDFDRNGQLFVEVSYYMCMNTEEYSIMDKTRGERNNILDNENNVNSNFMQCYFFSCF